MGGCSGVEGLFRGILVLLVNGTSTKNFVTSLKVEVFSHQPALWRLTDCQQIWLLTPNVNVGGGTVNAASNLAACQAACLASTTCQSIDFTPSAAAGSQCWLNNAQTPQGSFSGNNHYDLTRPAASCSMYFNFQNRRLCEQRFLNLTWANKHTYDISFIHQSNVYANGFTRVYAKPPCQSLNNVHAFHVCFTLHNLPRKFTAEMSPLAPSSRPAIEICVINAGVQQITNMKPELNLQAPEEEHGRHHFNNATDK